MLLLLQLSQFSLLVAFMLELQLEVFQLVCFPAELVVSLELALELHTTPVRLVLSLE